MRIIARERKETVWIPYDQWVAVVEEHSTDDALDMLKPRIGNWSLDKLDNDPLNAMVMVTYIERVVPDIKQKVS